EAFQMQYQTRLSLDLIVREYASKSLKSLSINDFLSDSFTDKDISVTQRDAILLKHAYQTVDTLLIYNARRIKAFRSLPYIAVLNPNIAENYNLYLDTMRNLLSIFTLPHSTDNLFIVSKLEEFNEMHSDTIPTLSKGFQEVTGTFLTETQTSEFLDQHLKERIFMRLISRQHTQIFQPPTDNYLGVIDLQLEPAKLVRRCSEYVNDMCELKYDDKCSLVIDSGEDVVFPYIPTHIEYVLTEVLKNSSRALIEGGVAKPIRVTIVPSYAEDNHQTLEIRVRDEGSGIPPETVAKMFDFSFSTYQSGEGEAYKTLNAPPGVAGNIVAGMGYGLPLSRAYVEMFGGKMSVQTYFGMGTDVYIRLNG
ncbi:hypothetical protein BABINDRAFT_28054, partial [Babjeviella inositovora NRRL Y-12698]